DDRPAHLGGEVVDHLFQAGAPELGGDRGVQRRHQGLLLLGQGGVLGAAGGLFAPRPRGGGAARPGGGRPPPPAPGRPPPPTGRSVSRGGARGSASRTDRAALRRMMTTAGWSGYCRASSPALRSASASRPARCSAAISSSALRTCSAVCRSCSTESAGRAGA